MLETFIEHKAKVATAKAEGKEAPRLPNYLGLCFMQIADRLGTRGNFSGYTYLDEMKADGIENCIIAANNFDPSKGENPFAYFTQIIWFAFLRRIDKEKKHSYIRAKSMQMMNIGTMGADGEYDDAKMTASTENEFMDVIVSDFEEKKRKKDVKYQATKKKKGIENFFETEDEALIEVERPPEE